MTGNKAKLHPLPTPKKRTARVLLAGVLGCSVSFCDQTVLAEANQNTPPKPPSPAAPAARAVKINSLSAMPTAPAVADLQRVRIGRAIQKSSSDLGIDAEELAGAISYETAGTFDPWKRGPTTKWGQHRGLIQWGEPQRRKYGVTQDSSVEDQMEAVTRYLRDAGVQPGMGLKDVYSAINAGYVGRYRARDAAQGGAPGPVADKVTGMGPHLANGRKLLSETGIRPRAVPKP